MKLYLSSYGVPTPGELLGLLNKPPEQVRITIIPNAKDYKLPDERAQSLDETVVNLEQAGLHPDVTDLREHDDKDRLRDVLKTYDAIWAAGGNTFMLRSEMRRSGFDRIIKDLAENGIVYCGESAGAIVAGLTLQGAEVADEPEIADQLIWEGLGLTDRIVAPHADNPGFVEYINHMKKLYEGDDRVLYLNDNQALTMNGNSTRLS
ncbi:MAG TPA: Type 1 glutamine amidotransferase-like domain-containing protein [Candidatus Saccharimonadales bacterium]|nr:Type 1 glutamine amidotransferase-like domain-containing protein [Candidatus Saccharimonadales bacterium]